MKQIQLPFRQKMVFLEGQQEVILDLEGSARLRSQCQNVVSAGLAIEAVINDILKKTVFRENTEDINFLTNHILESSWCGFADKRKLLFAVIERDNLLKGPEKSKLEKHLGKVTQWRNAFAHGEVEIHGSGVQLRYFEGSPRTIELDDDFWEKISVQFNDPFNLLMDLDARIPSHART